ncbi:MAG TPA: hypothetical protein VFB38_19145 [Chthonomonadaceae bacterium]|nr:hypothetical protein [Chthonomonadaceae bacterium]
MKLKHFSLPTIRNLALGLSLAAVLGAGLMTASPASSSQGKASVSVAPRVLVADGVETHGNKGGDKGGGKGSGLVVA